MLFACQGGQKNLSVKDEADRDSTAAPIFAESKFLNIDINMMAEEFQREMLPVSKKIDSSIAENAVYEMLLDSLLALKFEDFDLDEEPYLKKQHDDMWHDLLLRKMYQKFIIDSVSADSGEVLAAYEEFKDRFFMPKKYRARHIVISGDNLRHSSDSAEYLNLTENQIDSIAHDKVSQLRERLLTGANFDTLAMIYSQDPGSADAGGDLGYFELTQMVSPFDSTVEHTPIGSVSGLIKTRFGWHIVKVVDVADEHYQPFDSVSTALEALVKERKVAERATHIIDSISTSGITIIDTSLLKVDDSIPARTSVLALINPDDKVNGNDTLYFSDYLSQVGFYAQQLRLAFPLPLEDKIKLVNIMTNKFHMYRAAILMHYDQDPELEKWSYVTRLKYAISMMRKDLFDDKYAPTDNELKAYYDSHQADYEVERPFKVQHIVFADSNMAEYVRDVAMAGTDFDDLIEQYYPGDPDIKEAAANLGYIGQGDMPPSFWRAALITSVGDISRPVKTQYGFHIIKVLDKNNSMRFETAKGRIETILKEKHKKDLRNSYIIKKIGKPPVIHWDLLGKLYYKKGPAPVNPSLRGRP